MSDGSRSELYVYYRVAQASVLRALQTVRDFQRGLREQHPGLTARVLQRTAEHGEGVTLMEIYAFDDGRNSGIDPALRSRIEDAAAALAPLLSSPRRTEVFDALE